MAAANITSRSELAQRAGLHPTTVSRVLDDLGHDSSVGTLRAVAAALGLDVRDVAYWCGLSMELDEPYSPPEESALLSLEQRGLVDQVIRTLSQTNRHPRPSMKVSGHAPTLTRRPSPQ